MLFLVLAPPQPSLNLAEPRGTLVKPWWNPRGTLPQGRPGPLSAVGEKEKTLSLEHQPEGGFAIDRDSYAIRVAHLLRGSVPVFGTQEREKLALSRVVGGGGWGEGEGGGGKVVVVGWLVEGGGWSVVGRRWWVVGGGWSVVGGRWWAAGSGRLLETTPDFGILLRNSQSNKLNGWLEGDCCLCGCRLQGS